MARSQGSRSRIKDGRFRKKRSNIHVRTVEQSYSRNFGGRSDKHLGTLLKEKKTRSLNDLVSG